MWNSLTCFESYSGVPLASKIVEQLKQFVNCFGTYFLVMLYVVEAYKSLHNRIIINRKYEINLPSSAKLSMKLCHFFFWLGKVFGSPRSI